MPEPIERLIADRRPEHLRVAMARPRQRRARVGRHAIAGRAGVVRQTRDPHVRGRARVVVGERVDDHVQDVERPLVAELNAARDRVRQRVVDVVAADGAVAARVEIEVRQARAVRPVRQVAAGGRRVAARLRRQLRRRVAMEILGETEAVADANLVVPEGATEPRVDGVSDITNVWNRLSTEVGRMTRNAGLR